MAKTDTPAGADAFWLAFTGIAPFVLCASAWMRNGSLSALVLAAILAVCFFRYEPGPDFELKRALFLFRKTLPPAEDGSTREFAIRFGGLRFDGDGGVFAQAVPWSGVVVDWPDRRVWARGFGVALRAGRTSYAGSGLGPFCWGVVQTLPEGKEPPAPETVDPKRVIAVKLKPVDKETLKDMKWAPWKAAGTACKNAAAAGAKICRKLAEAAAEKADGLIDGKPAAKAPTEEKRQEEKPQERQEEKQ